MRHCFCMCFSDSLLQLVMKTIQQYSAPQLLYVSVCLWYVWFAMSSLLEGYFCFCIFFNSLRHNVLISLLMRPSPEWFGSLQHPGPHLHLNFTRFSLSPQFAFFSQRRFLLIWSALLFLTTLPLFSCCLCIHVFSISESLLSWLFLIPRHHITVLFFDIGGPSHLLAAPLSALWMSSAFEEFGCAPYTVWVQNKPLSIALW